MLASNATACGLKLRVSLKHHAPDPFAMASRALGVRCVIRGHEAEPALGALHSVMLDQLARISQDDLVELSDDPIDRHLRLRSVPRACALDDGLHVWCSQQLASDPRGPSRLVADAQRGLRCVQVDELLVCEALAPGEGALRWWRARARPRGASPKACDFTSLDHDVHRSRLSCGAVWTKRAYLARVRHVMRARIVRVHRLAETVDVQERLSDRVEEVRHRCEQQRLGRLY